MYNQLGNALPIHPLIPQLLQITALESELGLKKESLITTPSQQELNEQVRDHNLLEQN